MSRIISIGTAVPEYGTNQNTILDFMHAAYSDDTASRKLKILFNYSGINTRYSVIPDFNRNNMQHYLFNGNQIVPNVEQRLDIFKERAATLAIDAIRNALIKLNTTVEEFGITHLITVSCTGIYAPGIDVTIMEKLNLPDDIFHT